MSTMKISIPMLGRIKIIQQNTSYNYVNEKDTDEKKVNEKQNTSKKWIGLEAYPVIRGASYYTRITIKKNNKKYTLPYIDVEIKETSKSYSTAILSYLKPINDPEFKEPDILVLDVFLTKDSFSDVVNNLSSRQLINISCYFSSPSPEDSSQSDDFYWDLGKNSTIETTSLYVVYEDVPELKSKALSSMAMYLMEKYKTQSELSYEAYNPGYTFWRYRDLCHIQCIKRSICEGMERKEIIDRLREIDRFMEAFSDTVKHITGENDFPMWHHKTIDPNYLIYGTLKYTKLNGRLAANMAEQYLSIEFMRTDEMDRIMLDFLIYGYLCDLRFQETYSRLILWLLYLYPAFLWVESGIRWALLILIIAGVYESIRSIKGSTKKNLFLIYYGLDEEFFNKETIRDLIRIHYRKDQLFPAYYALELTATID